MQGDFQIESQPGQGCCIKIEIPMYISNNLIDFDNLESIERKEGFIKIDNKSADKQIQIAEESIIYPVNINEDYSCNSQHEKYDYIKIGEWQPFDLNYLL